MASNECADYHLAGLDPGTPGPGPASAGPTTIAGPALIELTDAAQPVIDAHLAGVTALHAAESSIFTADEPQQLTDLLARLSAHLSTLDLESTTAAAEPRRSRRGTRSRERKGTPP